MIKRVSTVLAVFLLALGSPKAALAADNGVVSTALALNGYRLPLLRALRAAPGEFLVAAPDLLTPLGAAMAYSGGYQTLTVTLKARQMTVVFSVNAATATVNGVKTPLSAPAALIDDVFHIPLGFFCQALGYESAYLADSDCFDVWTYNKTVLSAIDKIGVYCQRDELIDWLIGQYDPERGGFYYAQSSRDYTQFGVNIESTEQALGLLNAAKIQGVYQSFAASLPQKLKNEISAYVLSCQSDEDGYFYNPWQGSNVSDVKRERDYSRALSILNTCGVTPLYPLPLARIAAKKTVMASSSTYDWLASESALLAHLGSLNWSDPYSAGNYLASVASVIKSAGYSQAAADFVGALQNPQTGLWGEGYTYDATNAAMKIGAFYETSGIAYPNMEKAVDSVVQTVTGGDAPATVCEVWNPLALVNYIIKSHGYDIPAQTRGVIDAALADLIDITYENMQKFRQSDGGSSYWQSHGQSSTHGSVAGLGLSEGDMDATYIGTFQIRRSMYELCANSFIPPLYAARAGEIWDRLENAPAVQKRVMPEGLNERFEGCEPGGSLPFGVSATTNVGSVEIAPDPTNSENTAVKLTTVSGGLTSLVLSPYFLSETPDLIFECDIMVSALGAGSSFYNKICTPTGVQWCVSSPDGQTWSYSWRTNETGVGSALTTGLLFGRWYRIKIRYQPNGIDQTAVTYYLDGVKILTSDKYYNGNNASAPPSATVNTVNFNSFIAASGTLYFDNIRIARTAPQLELAVQNNKITVSGDYLPGSGTLYLAGYRGGVLARIKSLKLTAAEQQALSDDYDATCEYKAFLWDGMRALKFTQ